MGAVESHMSSALKGMQSPKNSSKSVIHVSQHSLEQQAQHEVVTENATTMSDSTDSARVGENTDDDTERVVVYELQRSMWDAALLLVLRQMSLADQIIIIAGVVFNAGLQLVLLLVIFFDMLEDPID